MNLEEGKVYLILSETPDGDITFGVVDTLDYENDNHRFLACMARGMLEQAIKFPVETIDLGTKAFDRDYDTSDKMEKAKEVASQVDPIKPGTEPFTPNSDFEKVQTVDGNVILFPKIKGNA